MLRRRLSAPRPHAASVDSLEDLAERRRHQPEERRGRCLRRIRYDRSTSQARAHAATHLGQGGGQARGGLEGEAGWPFKIRCTTGSTLPAEGSNMDRESERNGIQN